MVLFLDPADRGACPHHPEYHYHPHHHLAVRIRQLQHAQGAESPSASVAASFLIGFLCVGVGQQLSEASFLIGSLCVAALLFV